MWLDGEKPDGESAAEDGAPAAEGDAQPDAADAEWDATWDEIEGKEASDETPPDGDDPPSDKGDTPPSEAAGKAAEEKGESGASETEGDDPPDGDDAPDIWADAPEPLRSAYEEATTRADRAEHGLKSANGRINALSRRLDAVIAGEETPPASRQTKPKEGDDAPPKEGEDDTTADEEWNALEEEYPELAGPIGKRLKAAEERAAKAERALQVLGQDRMDTHSDAVERTILEEHPDFDEIAPKLGEWVQTQPAHIRAGYKMNAEVLTDADVVNDLVARYKADNGIKTPATGGEGGSDQPGKTATERRREAQRRSAAGAPKATAGAAPTGGREAPGEMTHDEAWDEVEADEEKRMKANGAAEARL